MDHIIAHYGVIAARQILEDRFLPAMIDLDQLVLEVRFDPFAAAYGREGVGIFFDRENATGSRVC